MITLEMADQWRSDLCVVFTGGLCTLELIKMLIAYLYHTALQSDKYGSFEKPLRLTYPIQKLVLQRIMVKLT